MPVLGEASAATAVSASSGAYDHLERVPQRSWAHLLRDIPTVTEAHPTTRG